MNQSEQIDQLATALAKAQGEITAAERNVENSFFGSKYADLGSCWAACRTPLAKNGLSVIQTTKPHEMTERGQAVTVITTLLHQSGQWIRGEITMYPEKPGPQAVGICLAYARRYGLTAIVGIAQADDDAEGSTDHSSLSAQKRTKIIKAMTTAVAKGDGPGLLEVVEELSQDEHQEVWRAMRSDERSSVKKLLLEARAAANAPDPNYIDPEPLEQSEKDQRRTSTRGAQ